MRRSACGPAVPTDEYFGRGRSKQARTTSGGIDGYSWKAYRPGTADHTARPTDRLALAVLDGPLRRLSDDRRGHDHRERRAAVDPARPRLLAGRPGLGRQCLSDRLRRSPAAGRTARRLYRPQAPLFDRARPFYRRVSALRPVVPPADSYLRAVHTGNPPRWELGGSASDGRHPGSLCR